MKTHRIAAIPGDGIGVPVTDAALAVASASGARLEVTRFDWSCET
jgi:tartrate dehydrogenase/decarboxylase/D-malate dehydrogenase